MKTALHKNLTQAVKKIVAETTVCFAATRGLAGVVYNVCPVKQCRGMVHLTNFFAKCEAEHH